MDGNQKKYLTATLIVVVGLPSLIGLRALMPQHYYLAGGSMEPSLPLDAHIFVQKRAYKNISQVQRGDVIVYIHPDKKTGATSDYVKRVFALPGDTVRIAGKDIWLNGRKLPHRVIKQDGDVTIMEETNGKLKYAVQYMTQGNTFQISPPFATTVPKGKLFCLGDNRDNSYDSRHSGSIAFEAVIGRMMSW